MKLEKDKILSKHHHHYCPRSMKMVELVRVAKILNNKRYKSKIISAFLHKSEKEKKLDLQILRMGTIMSIILTLKRSTKVSHCRMHSIWLLPSKITLRVRKSRKSKIRMNISCKICQQNLAFSNNKTTCSRSTCLKNRRQVQQGHKLDASKREKRRLQLP